MEIIELINEILKVVGSCDTCQNGAVDLEQVNDGEGWCYMFAKRPGSCQYYKPVENPLEHFVNIQLTQKSHTVEDISHMTQGEYEKNRDRILQTLCKTENPKETT